MKTIYKNVLCGFIIIMALFNSSLCMVRAAPAENNQGIKMENREKVLELEKGEQLLLPDKGEIEITDEKVVSTSSGGNVRALTEGETEIVVRYRIRVKKTPDSSGSEAQPPAEETGKQEEKVPVHKNEDKTTGNNQAEPASNTEEIKETERKEEADNIKQTENAQREEAAIEDTWKDISREEVSEEPGKSENKVVEVEIPDKECPMIEMENLPRLSSNQTAVAPILLIRDTNLNRESIRISLQGEQAGIQENEYETAEIPHGIRLTMKPITADDEYVLVCEAADRYGNRTKQRWVFTVNQGGTSFIYGHESRIQTGLFSPEIGIENVDAVEILDCLVNGESVPYIWEDGKIKIAEENLKAGKNRITLSVRDAAGNITDMEPWDFVLEKAEKNTASPNEPAENTEEGTQKETRAGKSTPVGLIFLMIGSLLVFWEKKMCYNGSRDFISENKGRNYERHGTQISGAPFRIVSHNRKGGYRDYQSAVHSESAKRNRTFSDRYPRGIRGIFPRVKEWFRFCTKENK